MTLAALALVLCSAVLHATWNLLAKRLGGGAGVVWLYSCVSAALLTPFSVGWWALARPEVPPLAWLFVVGSALLHVGYFLSLQRGYRVGELSLVYPLARGGGPALATVAAIVLLAERPTALALTGTALVAASAFGLAGGAGRGSGRAIGYGLLTAGFIASYTVWDATAVARVGVAPLLFMWASEWARVLMLTPWAMRRRRLVAEAWARGRASVVAIGALSSLAYLLVLTALTFTPVSYVAPAREISILIGAAFGARLLQEKDSRRRLAAAAGMVLGVALLTWG